MRAVTRRIIREMKDRPDLIESLRRAAALFNAMTPEQKLEHRRAQAKSWVVGEMMIEHPEMTRADAERIYDEVAR